MMIKQFYKWFSYKDNHTKPEHEAFVNPALSNRMGCFDGYCVATLPMMIKKIVMISKKHKRTTL